LEALATIVASFNFSLFTSSLVVLHISRIYNSS
jgi:hypothetical protein